MEIASYEIIDDVTEQKLKECEKWLKKNKKKCKSITVESYFADYDLIGITKKTLEVVNLVADVLGNEVEMESVIFMGELKDSTTKIVLKIHDKIVKLAWEPEQ